MSWATDTTKIRAGHYPGRLIVKPGSSHVVSSDFRHSRKARRDRPSSSRVIFEIFQTLHRNTIKASLVRQRSSKMKLEDDRLAAMLSESDRACRLCFKHQGVGCASEVRFFIAGFDSPHDAVTGCTARMGDKAKPSRIPRRRLCCLIAVPAVAPLMANPTRCLLWRPVLIACHPDIALNAELGAVAMVAQPGQPLAMFELRLGLNKQLARCDGVANAILERGAYRLMLCFDASG
jgi:hypothetical protein